MKYELLVATFATPFIVIVSLTSAYEPFYPVIEIVCAPTPAAASDADEDVIFTVDAAVGVIHATTDEPQISSVLPLLILTPETKTGVEPAINALDVCK